MLFGSHKKHPKYAVVFDITSGSVGAAFITHNHNDPTTPEILEVIRNPIIFDKKAGDNIPEQLASATQKTAQDIIVRMHNYKHKGKFDIHIITHAPWSVSTTHTNAKRLKTPLKITKEVIQSFVNTSFPEVLKESASHFNTHVMQVALNGYRIKKPLNKVAQELEVSIISSNMNPAVQEAIEQAIFSVFQGRDSLYMNTMVYATILMAQGNDVSEYIIADISEEYTTLTTVRNNKIKESVEIEFGSEYLVRALSEAQKSTLANARSSLAMFFKNTSTPAQNKKIKHILQAQEDDWVEYLGEAFAKLSEKTRMPEIIFLNTPGLTKEWFARTITKIDFAQFTATTQPPMIHQVIDAEAHALHFKNQKTPRDEQLLIASLFVDKYALANVHEDLFVL